MTRGDRTEDFEYTLPEGRIARYPSDERDQSRLLVMSRKTGKTQHRIFADLPDLMESGDVLVVNDSRVRAARFLGRKSTGAQAEVLLLRPSEPPSSVSGGGASTVQREHWEALVRPGNKLKAGRVVIVAEDLHIRIDQSTPDGSRRVTLESPGNVAEARARHGTVPLPPYMERGSEASDLERYQTVYANVEGSVAAPTAGLHFTSALLAQIEALGVSVVPVRLDVGVGTFRPVATDDPSDHPMHREWYEISRDSADAIGAARRSGGRVWAVGTTVVRVLESAALRTSGASAGDLEAGSGWTDLFIRPGFDFQVVDHLITNFHLPRSTLLMLVSAFAGYENTMKTYAEAVSEGYRFYSYGDAMVVL